MSRLRAWWRGRPSLRDEVAVVALAALARGAAVLWAFRRIPPVDDGTYYQIFAERLARGLGYTWAWPDGAVTYAAHYPVGYPAWLSLLYRVFGSAPEVGMFGNALVGTLGVWAVYRLALSAGRRGPAALCGVIAALHPSLVAYTPALMTEAFTSAGLVLLAWLAQSTRRTTGAGKWFGWLGLGLGGGALVLIRPQVVFLLPLLGALAVARSGARRLAAASAVLLIGVLSCLPWTLRNCERLDRCVFVSANGGWNLFIGAAPGATGAWVSLEQLGVPEECRDVFAEAEKDVCFGRAGLRYVVEEPLRFASLIPTKLSQTFDFSFAPGHYLRTANSAALSFQAMVGLGVAEALLQRLVLLIAFFGVASASGPNPRVRQGLGLLGAGWLFLRAAWISHVLLLLAAGLLGRRLWQRPNTVFGVAVIAATGLTHAAFFGAGRYGLVCVLPLIPLLADAFAPRTED